MKFVVKPPRSTTHSTGRPVPRGDPCRRRARAHGCSCPHRDPRRSSRSSLPERIAMSSPLFKLNSATPALAPLPFRSDSFARPAFPTTMTPANVIARPSRVIFPDIVVATSASVPRKIGGPKVPNDGCESQRYSHAERQAEIPHGQTESQATDAPERAPEVAPEEHVTRRAAEHAEQIVSSEARGDPGSERSRRTRRLLARRSPRTSSESAGTEHRSSPKRARPASEKKHPTVDSCSC